MLCAPGDWGKERFETARQLQNNLTAGPRLRFPGFISGTGASVLTPGHYILLCDVEARDGVRHFEKGMFRPIVVSTSRETSQRAAPPRVDAVVTMRDYEFAFSKPLRAGDRVLRVVNHDSVMHEFRLAHVLPGHTGRESLAWKPGGKTPRPDEDVMALVAVAPGADLMTTVSLVAGEYLVICVPQIAHGMMRVVRVLPGN